MLCGLLALATKPAVKAECLLLLCSRPFRLPTLHLAGALATSGAAYAYNTAADRDLR